MNKRTIALSIVSSMALTGCFTMDALKGLQEKAIELNQKSRGIDKETLCADNKENINKTYNFSIQNFQKVYGSNNDIQGASTQLYLIKNSNVGNFAKNYNAAEKSYNQYITLATQERCDISEYPLSPITVFENELEKLKNRLNNKTE